jgi:hypothetical protein
LDELIAGVVAEVGVSPEIGPRIRQTVMTMVLAGRASISVEALRVGRASDERPTAWPMARVEAASGQPWLTSLCHIAVPATPVLQALVPHLDGTQDRAALRTRFIAALQAGTVQAPELPAGQPPPSQARLDAVADEYVERALSHIASHALLQTGSVHVNAAVRP